MTKSDILTYLKDNQDARGIAHWKKREEKLSGLKSYGIGLTKLRKFAKQIGRDAKLARQLWNSKVHELRILALLIDDPEDHDHGTGRGSGRRFWPVATSCTCFHPAMRPWPKLRLW